MRADPGALRRDVAAGEHGVAERADRVRGGAHEQGGLGDARVEPQTCGGVHPLHRGPAADDALDRLADRQRRADPGGDQQRVALPHAEGLHPAVVDDRVHLRDLGSVDTDVDPRRVGAGAHPHEAVLRHLLAELRPERHLAAGDAVPLLLELRDLVGVVVAVRRGVDRGDVDRVVVDADLGQREPLDAGHAVDVPDPAHHRVAQRPLPEDQHVGGVQRRAERARVRRPRAPGRRRADEVGRVGVGRAGRVRRGRDGPRRRAGDRVRASRRRRPPGAARRRLVTALAIPRRPRVMVDRVVRAPSPTPVRAVQLGCADGLAWATSAGCAGIRPGDGEPRDHTARDQQPAHSHIAWL